MNCAQDSKPSISTTIMPPPTVGPMERAAKAARGHCECFPDGSIKASSEWFYNYSRLLLQGACEARLRSLGAVGDARAAVVDYIGERL